MALVIIFFDLGIPVVSLDGGPKAEVRVKRIAGSDAPVKQIVRPAVGTIIILVVTNIDNRTKLGGPVMEPRK